MKLHLLLPSLALLSWGIEPIASAEPISLTKTDINPTDTSAGTSLLISTSEASPPKQPISDIPRLSELERLHTSAKFLVQEPTPSELSPTQTNQTEATLSQTNQGDDEAKPNSPTNQTEPSATQEEEEIEIIVTGEQDTLPETSSPEYTITEQEIQKQGANSAAQVLRGLPGFAINDVGFGADIHTGTYYRGSSINQSVFVINGRPIGTNINTYHGATDLNSIPVE
ncbi:MAG: Plug domain-containing protein, partial [Coleofasciculus sp. C3-bin4]|nr:Plug domain-containing protein [Coleofasciculus sp. C3-bin4]